MGPQQMPRDSAKLKENGKRFRARREELGLTGVAVAKLVGVTSPSLSDWESGKTNILAENLLRLSQVLQINPFVLMGINDTVAAAPQVNIDRLSWALETVEDFVARKKVHLSARVKSKVLIYLIDAGEEAVSDKALKRLIGLAS